MAGIGRFSDTISLPLVKSPTDVDMDTPTNGRPRGYRLVVNLRARNATIVNIANQMPGCLAPDKSNLTIN